MYVDTAGMTYNACGELYFKSIAPKRVLATYQYSSIIILLWYFYMFIAPASPLAASMLLPNKAPAVTKRVRHAA